MTTRFSRRSFLRAGVGASALGMLPIGCGGETTGPVATTTGGKLLFVVAASGGASIVDSFLPVAKTDGRGGNAYDPDQLAQPAGSNLRCVAPLDNHFMQMKMGNGYPQPAFLERHMRDLAVVTADGTSVNHLVAARKSLTGDGINRGRTLGEACALEHGASLLLPNVNMAGQGFIEPGSDEIPIWARAEPVSDPRLFAFATDGTRGLKGAPSAALVARARGFRRKLEDASRFTQTFEGSELLREYRDQRDLILPRLEEMNLISQLLLYQKGEAPLDEYGLESSPKLQQLLSTFPRMATDPFEAQAALAFLLTRFGVSCSVTIGLSMSPNFDGTDRITNAQAAFDWSHIDHRGTQNAMWSRVLKVVDGLIGLLKAEDHLGDPALGKMWDRSLVYVATEFGRDKVAEGGSAHHPNNGAVFVSPLMRGNRVYGGVDPNTCHTYGFDPVTGAPDANVRMTEGHLYSAAAHALGIPFPGRVDMPAVVRGAG